MVDSVNGNGSSGLNNFVNPPSKKNLGQSDFLQLMVAQIQHQDPMEPMANGDFISQMAQFSTNDGVNKMQQSIEDLAYSLQSTQALQASSLVGKKVLVNHDSFQLGQVDGSKFFVNMPAPVDDMVAEVYAESGELVRKIPLGVHKIGQFENNWDGMKSNGERAEPGKYHVKVNGTYQGKQVALKTMATANVDSVSFGQQGEGVRLNVAGVGSLGLEEVAQITN